MPRKFTNEYDEEHKTDITSREPYVSKFMAQNSCNLEEACNRLDLDYDEALVEEDDYEEDDEDDD